MAKVKTKLATALMAGVLGVSALTASAGVTNFSVNGSIIDILGGYIYLSPSNN